MKTNYFYLLFLALFSNTLLDASQAPLQRKAKKQMIDHSYDKVFLYAAKKGNLDAIKGLFYYNIVPDINVKDKDGDTALIKASQEGNVELALMLIKLGADLDIKSAHGETALMQAVRGNHMGIAQALIAAGANVNLQDNYGLTALIDTALNSDTKITRDLIAAGANVNAQNNNGDTTLTLSSLIGGTTKIQALIAAGADVDIKNNKNKTARDLAPAKDEFDKAVKAGLAERERYSTRLSNAKKIVIEQSGLIPDLSEIITGYAYGQSPSDLPEDQRKECDASKTSK